MANLFDNYDHDQATKRLCKRFTEEAEDRHFLEQLRDRNPGRVGRMPRSIHDTLSELKRRRTFKTSTRLERLKASWDKVVGNDVAKFCEVKSYKQGELRVTVSSQALVSELGTFRAEELIDAMNAESEGKDRVIALKVTSGKVKRS